MVIGDFIGYTSLGLGSVRAHKFSAPEREAVTLEAKLDPKTPHEYSVQSAPPVILPPEKPTETKAPAKRHPQNSDPVSRVFLSVADYAPTVHKIDISV
jgi:hypothetical protein